MVKRTKALRLSFLRRNLDQEVDGSNPAYSLFPNFEERLEIKYIADIVRKKKSMPKRSVWTKDESTQIRT